MQLLYRIQRFIIRTLLRSYIRLIVKGNENVPANGSVIIAANHCSYLDPPLIGLGLPRQVTYLAKEELFSIPLLGWWLRSIGSYPVARGKGDIRVIKTALRLLKEDKTILIFPEGTRSSDGNLQPLEKGLAWLALKAGVSVLPVYTSDTFRLYPRSARFPKPGVVRFLVGKPILPVLDKETDFAEQVNCFTAQIETALKSLEAEVKNSAVE